MSGAADLPRPAPQLSIQLRNFAEDPENWSSLLSLARLADRLDVDRVVVSDHVVLGERLDVYSDPGAGGIAGGRQPTSPDGHWLEPLTLLTHLGAVTERVRLGTAVLLAALRPAPVLAKQLATLDVLTNGRVDLGVGVGWQREEYDACGLDFERRGQLLDDTLDVCQRLWTGTAVTAEVGAHRLVGVHSMPRPVQPGGVPVWISGRAAPRTARRLTRFGVGWIPWGDDVRDPTPGITLMRRHFAAAGRDPQTLQVQGSLPVTETSERLDVDAIVATGRELVAAGVTDLRLQRRWGTDPDADEAILATLAPALRDALASAS